MISEINDREFLLCNIKNSLKKNDLLLVQIKLNNKLLGEYNLGNIFWNKSTLEKLMPFIKYFSVDSKDPVVYVCQDYSCQLPTSDISKAIDLLSK